jgi:four helix bundle protein
MYQPIKHFTDLETWRVAHRLVLFVYSITRSFPNHEMFGIVRQMNRASVSITSNIAEGFGRMSFKEKYRFYLTARGSLYELESQSYIICDLEYLAPESFQELFQLIQSSKRLLNALIKQTKRLSAQAA